MKGTSLAMDHHAIHHYHNIFITHSARIPVPLPDVLKQHREQAQCLYPEAQYHSWSGEECRDFIRNHFDRDVLTAFDRLTPYAFRSDLVRYCLLYKLGGLYADLSLHMQNRWDIPSSCRIAAFTQRYDNMDLWLNTMQSLLWSLPGQREWELAIRRIVEHCRNHFYGPHDHYVTGPALAGFCFAQAMLEREEAGDEGEPQFMGEVRFTTAEAGQGTAFFITPARTLVATKPHKAAGDLAGLGLEGGNHYPQLWRAKQVYGERVSHWHLGEPMFLAAPGIVRTSGGLSVTSDHAGLICYGPYIDLVAGHYRLELTLCSASRYPVRLSVEIAHGADHRLYRRFRRYLSPLRREHTLSLPFLASPALGNVEFRIRTSGGFAGVIRTITLHRVPD